MKMLLKLTALYLEGWPPKEYITMNADAVSKNIYLQQHGIMRSEIHPVEEFSRNK